MATLAVAGLYNLETNVRIDGFPLFYAPVFYPFHGVTQAHGGVGFNVGLALHRLGNQVRLAMQIGDDNPGRNLRTALRELGLSDTFVLDSLQATPLSVILVAPDGSRQIHVDLKDIQEQLYPPQYWSALVQDADAVIACNINFSRPLLNAAINGGKLIATDVHVLADFDDTYNRDYLAHADILFLSHEGLQVPAEQAIGELQRRYAPSLIVIGLGRDGAMLGELGRATRQQAACSPRPVVNTIGAGDALFSAFVDQYLRLGNAWIALQRAQLYAAWKIGANGASVGLLDQEELAELAALGA